jgi:hypothetical protein
MKWASLARYSQVFPAEGRATKSRLAICERLPARAQPLQRIPKMQKALLRLANIRRQQTGNPAHDGGGTSNRGSRMKLGSALQRWDIQNDQYLSYATQSDGRAAG